MSRSYSYIGIRIRRGMHHYAMTPDQRPALITIHPILWPIVLLGLLPIMPILICAGVVTCGK